MENYIHLISRNLAIGHILQASSLYDRKEKGFENKQETAMIKPQPIDVREFTDNLSIGPIGAYETQISERKQWFKEVVTIRGTDWQFPVDKAVENLFFPWEEIGAEEKLILWYGDNIRDYMMVRYLASQYREYELYEADIASEWMNGLENESKGALTLAECEPAQIYEVFKNIKPMTQERKQQLISEWEQLKQGKGILRDLYQGQVRELEEDYYDEQLLKVISTQNYQKTESILRITMDNIRQENNNVVSRLWLEYRLKKMETEGKLISKNKPNQLRELLVKKVR
ncbi:MAG: DUF3658 domain-containing protein [Cellulosilyticaceae bacterium]